MPHFELDTNEIPSASTVAVCVFSILLIFIPLALRGGAGSEGSSVIFISTPPEGNQTIANEAMMAGLKPGALVFELTNHWWAHVICVAAGVEALLLWFKLCTMGDSPSFKHTTVISIGGLYTANNEFWLFTVLHHIVIIMLLLSPMSFHALILLVVCIVAVMSTMCEPGEDHEEDAPRGEVYCNRVASIFFYIFVGCIFLLLDARVNARTLGSLPDIREDLLFSQFFFNVLLVLVHVSIHVDISTCYYARLVYTWVCGGITVIFLAWA
jgi:hypothetical protein